ncbi:Protein DOG1-like 3 [Linum perenne]
MEGNSSSSSSSSSSSCPRNQSTRCFLEWMNIQQLDLAELLQALALEQHPHPDPHPHPQMGPTLSELAQKTVDHFQDYAERRAKLAQNDDVSCFFAPSWNSPLENSLLWLAGCRPSMFIRMLYALCGSQLDQSIAAVDTELCMTAAGNLGGLSWGQMNVVNELHMRTMREEERLTSRLASLQEDVADNPICEFIATAGNNGEANQTVNKAFEEHDKAMVNILKEADRLRLSTLKEVISVLTPIQAVDYLATGKKLHFNVHEWGKQRNRAHEYHGGSCCSTLAR